MKKPYLVMSLVAINSKPLIKKLGTITIKVTEKLSDELEIPIFTSHENLKTKRWSRKKAIEFITKSVNDLYDNFERS